jgi:hypothetical protein
MTQATTDAVNVLNNLIPKSRAGVVGVDVEANRLE